MADVVLLSAFVVPKQADRYMLSNRFPWLRSLLVPRRNPASTAISILGDTWVDDDGMLTIPVDPVSIANRLGIHVVEKKMGDAGSGAIVKEPGKNPVIYVEAGDAETRQRFTCAHELGHYLSRKGDKEYAYIDRRSYRASLGLDPDEVFANAFAAELLMPAAAIRHLYEDDPTVSGLAKTFGVSEEAMRYRLQNLNLRARLM